MFRAQPCSSMTNTEDACVGSFTFYASPWTRSSLDGSLPVGCADEEIFSTLSILRNTFSSILLKKKSNYFSILSIEADITKSLSYKEIIKDCAAQKCKRSIRKLFIHSITLCLIWFFIVFIIIVNLSICNELKNFNYLINGTHIIVIK